MLLLCSDSGGQCCAFSLPISNNCVRFCIVVLEKEITGIKVAVDWFG